MASRVGGIQAWKTNSWVLGVQIGTSWIYLKATEIAESGLGRLNNHLRIIIRTYGADGTHAAIREIEWEFDRVYQQPVVLLSAPVGLGKREPVRGPEGSKTSARIR